MKTCSVCGRQVKKTVPCPYQRKGLSVAVCPLPVLNQVNITVTDGKDAAITRNVAAAGGGIVDEIRDMKSALAEVAK